MSMKLPSNAIAVAVLATLVVGGLTFLPRSRADDLCRYDPRPPKPVPQRQVDNLGAIENSVDELARTYGADKVLIAFDIDNTLLTAASDFGSDAWFKWQDAILARPGCGAERVAADFGGLLEVQYLAYSIGDMRPTQSDTAQVIKRLVGAGHGVIALTARGPDIRTPTVRELGANGIAFTTAPPCRAGRADEASLCIRRGFIAAETILGVAEAALTESERKMLGPDPRPISYADGVMMVSGQNKGLMLRLLLASSPSTFEAIVFVDDGADNVIDVEQAFAGDETPRAVGFWYTAFEEANAAFYNDATRLDATVQAWQTLRSALCKSVGTYCAR